MLPHSDWRVSGESYFRVDAKAILQVLLFALMRQPLLPTSAPEYDAEADAPHDNDEGEHDQHFLKGF